MYYTYNVYVDQGLSHNTVDDLSCNAVRRRLLAIELFFASEMEHQTRASLLNQF